MNLVAPLYLAALAALALPWLLHRFSDAPPDRRPFPSTRFLEPTTPPVSHRRTLRHRALLALRVLALIALCLLFAEPWIPRPASLVDARALHVIAVDTSLSMRAGERFERALDVARERIAAVPEGDPVRVLGFDREVVAFGDETGAVAAAIAALDTLEPGYAASDYGRLMQRLDRLAESSPLPLRATLVSDAQRSSLPARRNILYAPRLSSLDIVDVAEKEVNVALAARARSDDGAQARVDVTVVASGGGAVDDPALERVVTVAHDGEVLARAPVSLAPGARESVVFERITLPERLEPRFDVAFEEGDALTEDDSVRVAVRFGGARRVALGALEARVEASSRVFASTALEAEGSASVDASTLAAGQLPGDERRLVVFTPLLADEPLPAELTRFVARGGSALIVDAVARSGGRTGARESEATAAPVGSSSASDAEATLRGSGVGLVDESHPLALGEIDWGAVRFFALGDYEPGEDERVLIETEDRRPVLIERPSESGLALVLNERLDGEDSNLPFQPAFVMLMRRIVDWFDTGRAVPERVSVGDAVTLPVNVQVLDPAGEALVALADSASAQTLRPETPGIYTIIGALGEQTLDVVLDPGESELAPIADDELADWLARHDTSPIGDGEADSGSSAARTDDPSGASEDDTPPSGSARERAERLVLWPLLLPLLAVLLLAETLFANRRLDVRREGT